MRTSSLNILVGMLVPVIFCEPYFNPNADDKGSIRNSTSRNKNQLFKDILTILHNYWSDTTPYKKTPAYITLNLNSYGQNTDDIPQHVKTKLSSADTSGNVSSEQGDTDDTRKRLYIPEKPSLNAISWYDMQKYPYNNIVKLSSGCTGTLLTPTHVLTAAHCVHNGMRFRNNMDMLKVEVPDKIGYRIHNVIKINVPVMWLYTQYLPEFGRGSYDYAVIQLTLPVSGRDKFMQLTLPSAKNLHSDFGFISFFPSISNGMWRSECFADDNYILMRGNVALRKCDSTFGNSGAATFTSDAIGGAKIVGVLSNTVSKAKRNYSDKNQSLESIMLLTRDKCLDICTMIYPAGEKYGLCRKMRRHHREYMRLATNRIMPIFG